MIPVEKFFSLIDDFCKIFDEKCKTKCISSSNRKRLRACQVSLSEIIMIIVMFHLSHYRTLKIYTPCLLVQYRKKLPHFVSYNCLLKLKLFTFMPLFILQWSLFGEETGKYFIDYTNLEVCHSLKIRSHRVFKDVAKRGKTSKGWFFGFTLYLVINNVGELMRFCLTTGEVDDRKTVLQLVTGLKGLVFGDKGYISSRLSEPLKNQGLKLYSNTQKNMKETFIETAQKFLLYKWGIIKSVIEQLKSILQIQHTRHRSVLNFQVNVLAGLIAYAFKPKKPSGGFHELNHLQPKFGFLTPS